MTNDYLLRRPDKWDSIDFVKCPHCQELTAYPGRWSKLVQCLVCSKSFDNPARFKDDYLQLESDFITSLTGLDHLCPLCFEDLKFRTMPDKGQCHWYCPNCGTEWKVEDLIAALNYPEYQGIHKGVQDPPHKTHRCPLCSAWLHFVGPWHCYNCGTDWSVEDLIEAYNNEEIKEE